MHHADGVAEPTMLCPMINVVSQTQLVYTAETLKLRRINNPALMQVNINETVNRIPKFDRTVRSHEALVA